jgi:hypothetical protein
MGEDFDNHRRIFDGGDDLQAAAAVRAVFDVDVEDPFEQPANADALVQKMHISKVQPMAFKVLTSAK